MKMMMKKKNANLKTNLDLDLDVDLDLYDEVEEEEEEEDDDDNEDDALVSLRTAVEEWSAAKRVARLELEIKCNMENNGCSKVSSDSSDSSKVEIVVLLPIGIIFVLQ